MFRTQGGGSANGQISNDYPSEKAEQPDQSMEDNDETEQSLPEQNIEADNTPGQPTSGLPLKEDNESTAQQDEENFNVSAADESERKPMNLTSVTTEEENTPAPAACEEQPVSNETEPLCSEN